MTVNAAQGWRSFRPPPLTDFADSKAFQSPNGVPNLATTDDIEVHARQRRILGTALSDRAVREQEYIIKQYTDLLIEKLHEQIGQGKCGATSLDISRWYMYTTFDITGDLQFGESFHALETSAEHPWVAAILNGLKFGMVSKFSEHVFHLSVAGWDHDSVGAKTCS